MAKDDIADVLVVGSGAGGGPLAYELSRAGARVLVLEKGRRLERHELIHDELKICRENFFVPYEDDEPHVLAYPGGKPTRTRQGWIACCVGGGTVHMSGFFLRLKPEDFRLHSELGPIDGTNLADWPISYAELAPFYDRVEHVIGVSGKAGVNPFEEPRSGPFPFPPLDEHPIAKEIDRACGKLGWHAFPLPRAILSRPIGERGICSYCALCGSYGCETGAKGSTAASVLPLAEATGRCEIRPNAMVYSIEVDARGRASGVLYFDEQGREQRARGRVIVVSASAIESARLLLNSRSSLFPDGLGNGSGQVGKNLTFSNHRDGYARFDRRQKLAQRPWLSSTEPFIHRCVQDFYFWPKKDVPKGGTLSFLFTHENPIAAAEVQALGASGNLTFGMGLKNRIRDRIRDSVTVSFESFCESLPNPGMHVTIDPEVRDRWGIPSARMTIAHHPHDLAAADALHERGMEILKALDPEETWAPYPFGESMILQYGTCRFGDDPKTSVLDRDCKSHEVPNLYVVDGSFMPNPGGVPPTMTIMANSFRVGEGLAKRLKSREI
ncbi:MAG: GMC family oxidoreductase [Deltaproteobacteria bacterium]